MELSGIVYLTLAFSFHWSLFQGFRKVTLNPKLLQTFPIVFGLRILRTIPWIFKFIILEPKLDLILKCFQEFLHSEIAIQLCWLLPKFLGQLLKRIFFDLETGNLIRIIIFFLRLLIFTSKHLSWEIFTAFDSLLGTIHILFKRGLLVGFWEVPQWFNHRLLEYDFVGKKFWEHFAPSCEPHLTQSNVFLDW